MHLKLVWEISSTKMEFSILGQNYERLSSHLAFSQKEVKPHSSAV